MLFSSISADPEERRACFLAFRSSWKGTVTDLLILACSGMFFTLAFPGIGFTLAAWTAIIPLIFLCERRTVLRSFFYGFVWGWFWNFTGCFFLREIMWFIPFVFAVILGLFSACFAAPIPFLFRWVLYPENVRKGGIRSMESFHSFHPGLEILCCFSLAGWWVCLEWIRSWIGTGFPWNLAAATQWRNLPLIQICEYTGIYGVSFLVVFLNLAAYFGIRGLSRSIPEGRYKRPWAFLLAVTMVLGITSLGAKMIQHRRAEFKKNGPEYALFSAGVVQPHLSQRRSGKQDETREALDICTELSADLLAEDVFCRAGAASEAAALLSAPGAVPPAMKELAELRERGKNDMVPLDVVIWPESAVPAFYYGGGSIGTEYRGRVRELMKKYSVPFLIGTLTADFRSENDYDLYNSALFLSPRNGEDAGNPFWDTAACYSKVHLVPWGEFVPLSGVFPKLSRLVGMGRDLSPGRGFHPLSLTPDVRAGALICYEDVFPYAAREQARAGANLLLVITNDAWYPTSFEPEQHYANSLFRAVETRLPMLRCGNSNYSVFINPEGGLEDAVFRRVDPETGELVLDPGRQGKGRAKFVIPVPKTPALTFYTRFGDLFVLLCWFLAAAGFLRAFFLRFGFRRLFSVPFHEEEERMKREFLGRLSGK